jgi:hypothetical protein
VQARPPRLQPLGADIHPLLGPDEPFHARLVLPALSLTGLSLTGLSLTGPSRAGLSRAGLSRAGLSRAGLSRAGLSRAGLSGAGLSRAGSSLTGLGLAGLGLATLGADVWLPALRGDGEAEVAVELLRLGQRDVPLRVDLGAAQDLLCAERDAEPLLRDPASAERDEPVPRPGPDPGPDGRAGPVVVEDLLDRAHYLAIAVGYPSAHELLCLVGHDDVSPRVVYHRTLSGISNRCHL